MPASSPRNSYGNFLDTDALISAQVVTATTNVSLGTGWSGVRSAKFQLIVAAVGGTTPNYTLKLQDSYDGTNWVDVTSGAFAAVTANGTSTLLLPTGILFDNLRAVITVTGTTPTATITLYGQSVAWENV